MKSSYKVLAEFINDLTHDELHTGYILLWSINERLLYKLNEQSTLQEILKSKNPYEFRIFNLHKEIHVKKVENEWLCSVKTDEIGEKFEDEVQVADNELNKEIKKCLGQDISTPAVTLFHLRKYIKYDEIGLARYFAVRLLNVSINIQ